MKKEEVNFIKDLYRERILEFGQDPKALGWTRNDQELRFERLTRVWNLKNLKIIDYGCGFGDLYSYLCKTGLDFDYIGVDISPEMIKEANKLHPKAKFEVLSNPLQQLPKCDIIFACGAHALKLEDNHKFVKDSFALFKKSAKVGFCVTFLSIYSNIKHKKNYYSNPEFILNHSFTLSKRILLDNMFMPFEFAVFVDFRENLVNLSYSDR